MGRVIAKLSKDVAAKLEADAKEENRSTDEIADEAIIVRRAVIQNDHSVINQFIDNRVTNNTTKTGGTWTILSGNVVKFFVSLKAKVEAIKLPEGFVLGFATASILWGYFWMIAAVAGH